MQPQTKLTEEQKATKRAKVDAEVVHMFNAEGFKNVQPRVNVMTYNKWLEAGRKVKKGTKGIRVAGFNLFHIDSTEPIDTQH